MALPEELYPLLAARAATDPESARLLELLTKADEALGEITQIRAEMSECPSSRQLLDKIPGPPLTD